MLISDESNAKLVAGMRLPIPYVEKATVYNDNIDLVIGLYLIVPTEQSIEDSIEPLKDLHFYIGQIFDGPPLNFFSIEYSESELELGTQRMSNILDNKGVMSLLVDMTNPNLNSDSFSKSDSGDGWTAYVLADHKKLASLTINDFEFVNHELIDVGSSDPSEGSIESKVLNFKASTTLTSWYNDSSNANVYFNASELELTMSLVCFSSVLDLSGMNDSTGNSNVESARQNIRHLNLYNSMFSQPSFKEVFRNGAIETSPTKLFILPNGKIYNGDAIQTIDGSYYTSDNFSRDDVVVQFESIMPSEEYIMNSATGFQIALTSFRAIIYTYKDTEELLPRLQVFSQTYIDKTTTTQAGLWYQNFNSNLLTINSGVLSSETRIFRELVITPTVVDGRTIDEGSYEAPESSEYTESDYIYATPNSSMLMTRLADYGDEYGESVQLTELTYNYNLIENGFFFFDYEKARRTQTVLSKVFNMSMLDGLFGSDSEYINKYFKLSSVTMNRNSAGDSGIYAKTTTFADSLDSLYPLPEEMTYFIYSNDGATKKKYNFNGDTIYPTLTLRNVVVPENESFSNYGLMCFEFQDIMDSGAGYAYGTSPRDKDSITIDIRCVDYSKQLIFAIMSSSMNFLTGTFNDYYEAAEEFCSYNNIDGHFNDFFVNAMNETYSGSAETVPWIAGPTIYNIHKELVTGIFNSDMQKITDSSIILSERIAPATGDLENLRVFKENFENLNNFYTNMDLSMYDDEEEHIFSTSALVSLFARPDVMNYEPEGETSFDTAQNTWISIMEGSLEQFAQDMINLMEQELGTMDSGEASEFVNTAYDSAADIMKSITVLSDLFKDDAFNDYTPEEKAAVTTASLTAVGVGAAMLTAFVAASIGAAAVGGAAITIGAVFVLALPVIAIIALVAAIIGVIVARIAKANRRDLTSQVEGKLYDFVVKLVNQASELSGQAGGVSFPTNQKDALTDCFSNHPELTYGLFLFLMAFYDEIDPDGEDKIGDINSESSIAHAVPIEGTSGVEDIIDFILSRAIPYTGE